MSELIASKQADAKSNDATVLRALAAAGDDGVSATGLAAVTGLPERTVRACVGRLSSGSLAGRIGARGRIFATTAGRAEAGAELPGLALVPALEAAVRRLPAEGLRAFTRLLLSAIVARYHLRRSRPHGWPGFMAVGPTKTGKTAVAELACQAIGRPHELLVRTVTGETELSLWGRRERPEGAGWTLDPSPLLAEPFLCLDEFDKARGEVRTALMKLLQGDARAAGEGVQIIEIAPTVMLCSNATVSRIPSEYRRRSVVLDTTALVPQLEGLHEIVLELLAGGVPRLELTALRPPVDRLPDDVRRAMLAALRAGLTDAGYQQLDERAAELMALGRAALDVSGDLVTATMATAADYLTCARTVAEARPGTPDAVREQLGGPSPLRPDLEAAAVEEVTQSRRRDAHAAEDLAFVRARSTHAEGLRQTELAIRQVPVAHRADAKGLRDTLVALIKRVQAQRSPAGLEQVLRLAASTIDEAVGLRRRLDDEKRAEDQRLEQERRQGRQQREELQRKRQWASQAAATDRQCMKLLAARQRELQRAYNRVTTKPHEKPADELVALGVIELRAENRQVLQEEAFLAPVWRKVRGQQAPAPSYRTVRVSWYVDRAGQSYGPAQLAEFGTAPVLAAVEAAAAAEGLRLTTPKTGRPRHLAAPKPRQLAAPKPRQLATPTKRAGRPHRP